ncbi:MAG: RNA polymerase sigma factor [Coprobacillaceae bacterium]
MDKKEELTQIVKEVQNDIGQFEKLYSQIVSKIYFWCYSIVRNETLAKDLSQESMIRIYHKLHTLKNPDGFSSWMYIVVRNVCNSYLKVHKNDDKSFLHSDDFTVTYEENIEENRSYNLPDVAYDVKEKKALIREFIDKLPRKQREVIILYYLEEFKTTEIAEALQYNIGSVRSSLHSGRKNLELQIKDYQDKNHVKLYNSSVLPLLGFILSDYRDELYSKQKFQYNKSLYNTNNALVTNNLFQLLSNKLIMIVLSIICVTTIVIVIGDILQKELTNTVGGMEMNVS